MYHITILALLVYKANAIVPIGDSAQRALLWWQGLSWSSVARLHALESAALHAQSGNLP